MIATRTRSKFSFQKGKRCFLLAFATAVSWIFLMQSNAAVLVADAAATSDATSPDTTDQAAPGYAKKQLDLGVIDLTSKNFGTTVAFGDGNVWLIEFYTPTCSHCVSFASTYQSIAKAIHSSTPDEKIRVARVNCSEEKALMTRFGVTAFPSFFLVTGWEVYKFEGSRTATILMDYARGGYKKKNPIPFINSPMGPMGLLQGTLVFVGTRAMGLLEDMHERFGISPIVSGVIISIVGVFCGMISIVLLTVLSTPKSSEKID